MRPRSTSAPRRDDGNYGALASSPTATGSETKQRFGRSKSSEKQRSSTPKRRWNFLRRKRNDEDVTERPFPDERRDAAREYGAHGNSNLTKCDCCEVYVSKSRDEMYERNGCVYCSTKCTKEHQQYLSSQRKGEEFGNSAPGFGNRNLATNQRRSARAMSPVPGSQVSSLSQRTPHFPPGSDAAKNHSFIHKSNQRNQSNSPGARVGGTYLNNNNSISQSMSSGSKQQDSYSTASTSTPHHMNQFHSNVTKKLNSSPFKAKQLTGLTRNELFAGRGISDEYADYNDELSRQLRMASRQDKLELQEKQFQREQFSQKTRTGPVNRGVNTAAQQVSSGLNEKTRRSGDSHSISSVNIDTTSLRDQMNMKSDAAMSKSIKRMQKHKSETSTQSTTQSTGSISSVSRNGSFSPPRGPVQGKKKVIFDERFDTAREDPPWSGEAPPKMPNRQNSASSWGFSNVDVYGGVDTKSTSSDVRRAFDGLSGWPAAVPSSFAKDSHEMLNTANNSRRNEAGVKALDGSRGLAESATGKSLRIAVTSGPSPDKLNAETPRKNNLTVCQKNIDSAEGEISKNVIASREERRTRSQSPAMSPSPSRRTLGSIREEAAIDSFSPKRRQLSPPNSVASVQRTVQKAKADHTVEDVASLVSCYDDPSVGMLSSIATMEDTITTRSSFGPKSRRGSSEGVRTGLAKRSARCEDPPGNSIDELLQQGFGRPHMSNAHHQVQQGRHQHQRSPSPYRPDPSVNGSLPSHHGMDPEDMQQALQAQHEQSRGQSRGISRYTTIDRQQHEVQYEPAPADVGNFLETPPQLRHNPPPQDWHWNTAGGQQEETDDENAFDLVFHSPENFNQTSVISRTLTGDLEEEPPPVEAKQDDESLTQTLDTVDLVAEVKRVWRHVQRYENKKEKKKRFRDHYQQGGTIEGAQELESPNMMDQMLHQFGELNTVPMTPQHDGASKMSELTSSPGLPRATASRGRSNQRPSTTSSEGRLGQHIRSTSAHSKTHARAPSPGMDSNEAKPSSLSSRENEAVFSNEKHSSGATKPKEAYGAGRPKSTHVASMQEQLRNRQAQRHPSQSDLSKPYDLSKVKSTGTSFTQKTQRISNMDRAPNSSSGVRSSSSPSSRLAKLEMAKKYIKGKRGTGADQQRQQYTLKHAQVLTGQQAIRNQINRDTRSRRPDEPQSVQDHEGERWTKAASGLSARAMQNASQRKAYINS